MSSSRDFLALREVIEQLDEPRRQVYIETMILTSTLDRALDVGTSAHGGCPDERRQLARARRRADAGVKSTRPHDTVAGASGLIGGCRRVAAHVVDVDSRDEHPVLRGAVQALAKSSNSNADLDAEPSSRSTTRR